MKSESLCIRVTESGETRVNLSFASSATTLLAQLVPPSVRTKLAQRSIDLAVVADEARARDFAPGELFRLDDGPRTVRVWLE